MRPTRIVRLAVAAMCIAATACSAQPSDAAGPTGQSAASSQPEEQPVNLRISADGRQFIARLDDSEAAHDFAAMLPLTLTLTDYNRTEKIADLPARITTGGAPEGITPVAGDLTYYAPWGNLAIFYRDLGYSSGLVRIGRIEADATQLAKLDGIVAIERLAETEQIQTDVR